MLQFLDTRWSLQQEIGGWTNLQSPSIQNRCGHSIIYMSGETSHSLKGCSFKVQKDGGRLMQGRALHSLQKVKLSDSDKSFHLAHIGHLLIPCHLFLYHMFYKSMCNPTYPQQILIKALSSHINLYILVPLLGYQYSYSFLITKKNYTIPSVTLLTYWQDSLS